MNIFDLKIIVTFMPIITHSKPVTTTVISKTWLSTICIADRQNNVIYILFW